MPVPVKMADLYTIAASNSPAGSDPIGNSLDDYIRAGFAIVRSTNALASASIAAAPTTDLSTADAESVQITGASTITSLGTAVSGLIRECRFTGACTITNSSSIVLPFGSNITTQSGDVFTFRSLGSGNWVMVGGSKGFGSYLPLAGGTITGNLVRAPGSGNVIDAYQVTTGSSGIVRFQRGSVDRCYLVGLDSTAESGGNSGGNFGINHYDDSGNFLRTPFQINRATGVATFSTRPVFGAATPWDSANFNPGNYVPISGGVNLTGNIGYQLNVPQFTFASPTQVKRWLLQANISDTVDNGFQIAWWNGSSFQNKVSIATNGVTFADPCSGPDFTSNSDVRLKSNITELRLDMDDLKKMMPRSYVMNGIDRCGFIAQEVQRVLPSAVSRGDDGYLSLSYGQLVALVASCLLSLEDRVKRLEQQ